LQATGVWDVGPGFLTLDGYGGPETIIPPDEAAGEQLWKDHG